MPAAGPAQPVFFIIFGAFMAVTSLQVWRSLWRRFSPRRTHGKANSFSVDAPDQVESALSERQSLWATLTPRELEIARLVRQGKRNSEIARDLHISVRTVETHLYRIYEKLGVRSRTELAHVIRDLVD